MSLDHIAEQLRDLAVPIETLATDPNNVRLHDERGLATVAKSLERFGQRTPIVVRNGVVLAGNARLTAARDILGWTHIAAITANNDDDMTAQLYAITDNRTSDLSEFDMAGLASILTTLKDDSINMAEIGWTDGEMNEILSSLDTPTDDDWADGVDDKTDKPESERMTFVLSPEDMARLKDRLMQYDPDKNVAIVHWLNT